jgi:hypothetical protein
MGRAKKVGLGVGALAMINVAAIVSVRNLPVMAEYGWSMLVLFAISIVVFLIPISMVAAELGTTWNREGGVFAWVKEAFGGRTGFLAVWCDYSENLAWFPTVLSFMAATLAFAINPDLANNSVYLVVVMLVFFWLTTLLNVRGVRASSLLGSIGTIAGSIVPALLLVGLGVAYLLRGDSSQIPFSGHALVPDLHLSNLAFLGGIILLFTGMEMAGFHARDTRNPGRDIPRSIALAVLIIVAFSVLGSLFTAIVLPQKEISLVSGTMQLFRSVLDTFHASWLVGPLAVLIAFGGVAHLSPWILGPAKGMAEVARQGRECRRRPGRVPHRAGGRRDGLLVAVPADSERVDVVLDAVGRHGPDRDHHVWADVRRGDPAALHPARRRSALPDPGRHRRRLVGGRGRVGRLRGVLHPGFRAAEPAQDRQPGHLHPAAGRRRDRALGAAVRDPALRPPYPPATAGAGHRLTIG